MATYAEYLHNSVTPPATLWHYTTHPGLLGIIQGKSLWATKIHYLNDSSEFSYALGLVGKILEKRIGVEQSDRGRLEAFRNSIPNIETINVCVASFRELPDDLSQWRAYSGPAGGHAIGFNSEYLRATARAEGFFLTRCRYVEAEQRQLINHLIDWCLSEQHTDPDIALKCWYFPARLARLAPVLKDSSFEGEREWRLISQPRMVTEMCFREGKSMLVPYTKFELKGDTNSYLTSITVGPSPNLSLSKASIVMFLRHHDVQEPEKKVIESKIPYRNW
ncbi:MAG: DUF2971 domain-containing protein [Bryobacteraceae bacterium]